MNKLRRLKCGWLPKTGFKSWLHAAARAVLASREIQRKSGHRSGSASPQGWPGLIILCGATAEPVSTQADINADGMTIAWQIKVSGNFDNTDCDNDGTFAYSTAYHSEIGMSLAKMFGRVQP